MTQLRPCGAIEPNFSRTESTVGSACDLAFLTEPEATPIGSGFRVSRILLVIKLTQGKNERRVAQQAAWACEQPYLHVEPYGLESLS